MKTIKPSLKSSLAFLLTLFLFGFISVPGFAYNTFSGHVLRGGVGNSGNNTRYYYLDSSASGYSMIIDAAVNTWNNTKDNPGVTTPIWFKKTTTKSSSVMDYYAKNSSDTSVLGETLLYSGSGSNSVKINPNQSNWTWGKVLIYKNSISGMTTTKKQGVVAHEMGHVMGLAHNNTDPKTIMCQTKYGRSVYRPAKDDCHGINYLYK